MKKSIVEQVEQQPCLVGAALSEALRLARSTNLARETIGDATFLQALAPDGIPLLRIQDFSGNNQRLDAVIPETEFRTDGLRTLVRKFYTTNSHEAPPGFFRGNRAVNAALAEFLQREFRGIDCVRVREIGAGGYGERWSSQVGGFLEGQQSLQVTLSDFVAPAVNLVRPRCSIRGETEDLYGDLETLPDDKRAHLIIATYVLDSLSFPGDRFVRKAQGQWFEALIRPREQALRVSEGQATEGQFEAGYEWVCRPLPSGFDLTILAPYDSYENTGYILLPLGTATFMERLVKGKLLPGGMMLVGEIGSIDGRETTRKPIFFTHEGAPFCHCQMPLLSELLTQRGLVTEVLPVGDFVKRYVAEERLTRVPKGDLEMLDLAQKNHGFLIMRS